MAPADVAGVQAGARRTRARDGLSVRAVGSRHSFTGAAVSHGVQLTMGRMARLVDVDQDSGRVVVEAGMPLYRLNELLAQHGLAMPNLGDIDQQTISGADLHRHPRHRGQADRARGSGPGAGAGAGRRLGRAPARGTTDPDLFDAARVSVGALGVITQVTLQAVPAFELRAVEASVPLDQVLAELDSYVDGHDHFEFYWFPHADRDADQVQRPARRRASRAGRCHAGATFSTTR